MDYIGESHACRMMRSRLCWFAKGLPHASFFRESIRKITTQHEAHDRINEFWEQLNSNQKHFDF
jgi:hypothetical protein